MKDVFDANEVSFRIGALKFDAGLSFDRLLEASPFLARQFIDECEEKMGWKCLPVPHRQSA